MQQIQVKVMQKSQNAKYKLINLNTIEVTTTQKLQLKADAVNEIYTGILLEIESEKFFETAVFSANKKFSIINAPGTIDMDYRGEVILLTRVNEDITVEEGEILCYFVIREIQQLAEQDVEELNNLFQESKFNSTQDIIDNTEENDEEIPDIYLTYQSEKAAGLDAYCKSAIKIPPFNLEKYSHAHTFINIFIPTTKFEVQIRSRSGFAKKNIRIDYSSVLLPYHMPIAKIMLFNYNKEEFLMKNHTRICQLVFNRIHFISDFIAENSIEPNEDFELENKITHYNIIYKKEKFLKTGEKLKLKIAYKFTENVHGIISGISEFFLESSKPLVESESIESSEESKPIESSELSEESKPIESTASDRIMLSCSSIDLTANPYLLLSNFTETEIELFNHTEEKEPISLLNKPIAKIVFYRNSKIDLSHVEFLSETLRGSSGFGSTGIN